MTLPHSYEHTFRRFDDAGGRWIPTWNWSAFLFHTLWYFYQRLWIKAVVYTAVLVIIITVTQRLAIPLLPLLWLALGVTANYDLYLLERKGTQLWKGVEGLSGVAPNVTNSPIHTPSSSSATVRLTALDNARNQGIFSDTEYAQKRRQLEHEAEREKKLVALEEARRAGVLSELDYKTKKRDIVFGEQVAMADSTSQ